MRFLGLICIAVAGFGTTIGAQQERRELGAHQHGAGKLNVAIEGNRVSVDFSAPADDIVGFEHQPSSTEQRKSVANAKAILAQPNKLFGLSASAGCKVEAAKVVFNAKVAKPVSQPAEAESVPKAKAENAHADFDVDYTLVCKAVDKITSISFPYFKQFPKAQKLSVTIVAPIGQLQHDVDRNTLQLEIKTK